MRLIDADRALEIVRDQSIAHPNAYHLTNYATLILREAPTVDAAEVVHGQWGTHSDRPDSLICSVCNCGFDMWKHELHNYCPNCGAKTSDVGELKEKKNKN